MEFLWLFLVGLAIPVLALTGAYLCYRKAFYSAPRVINDDILIPEGEIYEPYREQMENWTRQVRAMPHEECSITSFDGLTLRGNYYEHAPGAPIELMFHGYRGNSERDLCGGVQRCFLLGHSALIVDQRGCGKSDGDLITFGINEQQDCLDWVNFMIQRFGPDVKIILTGISMGAATVTMAADKDLPKNVIGILADCGYTSPKEIIKKVIQGMHLPVTAGYFLVRFGASFYANLELDAPSCTKALAGSKVPVIFFHGEADDFVPCEMSRVNFEACSSKKKLVTVPDAGHGLCYLADPEGYLAAAREFFSELE